MIVIDCKQGSQEWLRHRQGVPTASEFSRIFTGGGKVSTAIDGYIGDLLAEQREKDSEYQTDVSEWAGNEHTQRGNELEPVARFEYTLDTGRAVEEVGFCLTDDKRFGCSPDGFIDDRKGGMEIKSPQYAKHIERVLKGVIPNEHKSQIHGCLIVTGCEYWDYVSYAEDNLWILRVERDDYTTKMEKALGEFWEKLEIARGRFSG